MVGCRVGVPGAVIVLSVKVSAELDAVIGCWGTDKKWPSCGGCDHLVVLCKVAKCKVAKCKVDIHDCKIRPTTDKRWPCCGVCDQLVIWFCNVSCFL